MKNGINGTGGGIEDDHMMEREQRLPPKPLGPRGMAALDAAGQFSRDATSFFARLSTRIDRYSNGWKPWEAWAIDVSMDEPFNPIGIEVMLRRMPWVAGVLVEPGIEGKVNAEVGGAKQFSSNYLRIQVRFKKWLPERYREWAQEQVEETIRERCPHQVQAPVTFF